MPKKIELFRGFDAWSCVHLFGCYFLMSLGLEYWQVFILGVIWEILDFVYAIFKLRLPLWFSIIFDPRGADIIDVAFDIIGIVLWILLV